jgi:O-antigen ligase
MPIWTDGEILRKQPFVSARRISIGSSAFLGAAVWLWPMTVPPVAQVLPNLVALTLGVVLWNVLPRDRVDAALSLAAGWASAAFLSALIAILQYFDLEGPLFPLVAQSWPGFAYANTRQPNHLATLLGVGLLALFWLQRTNRLSARVTFGVGGAIVVALAATASRTGALHLMLIVGMVAFWGGAQRKRFMLMCAGWILLYIAAALLFPWVSQHFLGAEGRDLSARMAAASSCSSRQTLWENVLYLIGQKPLTGWGWGGLVKAHYATIFDGPRFCDLLTNAHNLPLHIAVELGIPVALMFCFLIAWLLFRNAPWRETDSARQLVWGALLLIGVHSLLEFPLWYGNFQVMTASSIWYIWLTRTRTRTRTSESIVTEIAVVPSEYKSYRSRLLKSVVPLALLAVISWDYFRVSQLFVDPQERAEMFRENTLEKVRHSWFFSSEVLYGQVVNAHLDGDTAAAVLEAATVALSRSPEPRVIEMVIKSATMLGQVDLAQEHAAKYQLAWPEYFKAWQTNVERTKP